MNSLLPRSIQARLIFSHLVVSLISVTLISIYAGGILFSAVRQQVEHHYEDLIFAAANDVEIPLADYLTGNETLDPVRQSIGRIFVNMQEVQYTLYLPDGVPLVDSTNILPEKATPENAPELWDAINNQIGEGEYFRNDEQGRETLYLAVRIQHDGQAIGVLRIAAPLESALASARSSLGLLISGRSSWGWR